MDPYCPWGWSVCMEWGRQSDRLGIQKCGLPPSKVSAPPPPPNLKIRICLHCRLWKSQDEKLVALFFFCMAIYQEWGKSPRPLLLGVRFPPLHINNLLSLSPPLPVLLGHPIAERNLHCRNLHCRLLITYREDC